MASRKVACNTTFYYHQIPQAVKNSLFWAHPSQNLLSRPFLPKPPLVLATNIIKSYFEKGQVGEARILFDEMPERDVVAWTAMIAGYTSCHFHRCAWTVFCEMMKDCTDVVPNEYTFSNALKACKGMKSPTCGSLVHGLVLKYGMHGCLYVDNVLLDVYATCCETMDDACLFFWEIRVKTAVSWTILITGYTHQGDAYGALCLFRKMLLEEVELNPFCISIAVRACTSIGSYGYGKQVHAALVKHGFESNIPEAKWLVLDGNGCPPEEED